MSRSPSISPIVPLNAALGGLTPPNQSVLIAREMLGAVLGPNPLAWGAGSQVIALVLPDEAWAKPVRDAWSRWARGGREAVRVNAVEDAGERDWVCLSPDARPSKACDALRAVVQAGVDAVVLATADASDLDTLRAAADQYVEVPPPDWGMVVKMASENLAPALQMPPEPAPHVVAAMTPETLGLAVRREDCVGSYLQRLIAVASRQAVEPKPVRSQVRGLARVPGLSPSVEAWVQALLRDIADYRAGRIGWADVDRGAVISGPPGCGKTTLALALAEQAGVPLISGSHALWQSHGHQGEMLKAMRRSFGEARAAAPCILFLDELDSFPDRRSASGENAGYMQQVVNALLAELDGAVSREGVVVVGACNNASLLDPALTRPGRLERVLVLGRPNAAGIEAALRVHLATELVNEPLVDVAVLAHGMTGAEAEAAVRAAKRSARTRGAALTKGDLMLAIAEARGLDLTTTASGSIH